jgi:hypothetical protein
VDTVLGVSMAPTTVRMVLVEGQNADGVTVDEDNFKVAAAVVLQRYGGALADLLIASARHTGALSRVYL